MNKAELARFAIELRAEIGLDEFDPFDAHALAEEYGVRMLQLSEVGCSQAAVEHFHFENGGAFSGALVPLPDGGVAIIENDGHSEERRLSTAGHELGHVLLEHPFTASIMDEKGCRTASTQHEKEATELGAELVLPAQAARRMAVRGMDDYEVAERMGVSHEFAQWRMNVTGARIIAARAKAKRTRR